MSDMYGQLTNEYRAELQSVATHLEETLRYTAQDLQASADQLSADGIQARINKFGVNQFTRIEVLVGRFNELQNMLQRLESFKPSREGV